MNGQFFEMTCDQAMMHPMIELSSNRSQFIPEILYIYNRNNPCNDHKINVALQMMIEGTIRSQAPYKPLKRVPRQYLPRR